MNSETLPWLFQMHIHTQKSLGCFFVPCNMTMQCKDSPGLWGTCLTASWCIVPAIFTYCNCRMLKANHCTAAIMVHSSKPAFNLNSGQYDEAAKTATTLPLQSKQIQTFSNNSWIIRAGAESKDIEGCSIMHKEKCLKDGPAWVPVTASISHNGDQPTSQAVGYWTVGCHNTCHQGF